MLYLLATEMDAEAGFYVIWSNVGLAFYFLNMFIDEFQQLFVGTIQRRF